VGAWPGGGAPASPPPSAPDKLSTFDVDDADPEGHVPTAEQGNGNPLQFGYWLMDVAAKADEAEKKGDHRTAIKYYRALARAVPDRSVSYGKMCAAYEALGERDHGLQSCRDALGRQGVRVEDFGRYVRLLLDHPGPATSAEQAEITEIANHLRGDPATRVGADEVDCQLAVRMNDRALLRRCVAQLVVAIPDNPITVTYQFALAVEEGDLGLASRLLERARLTGVQGAGLADMEKLLRARRRWRRLPVWGGSLCGLVGLVLLLRRRGSGDPGSGDRRRDEQRDDEPIARRQKQHPEGQVEHPEPRP
jgi:hypothetical protein